MRLQSTIERLTAIPGVEGALLLDSQGVPLGVLVPNYLDQAALEDLAKRIEMALEAMLTHQPALDLLHVRFETKSLVGVRLPRAFLLVVAAQNFAFANLRIAAKMVAQKLEQPQAEAAPAIRPAIIPPPQASSQPAQRPATRPPSPPPPRPPQRPPQKGSGIWG